MKRSILFIVALFAIILGCNTSKTTSNNFFGTDNLPLQEYTIDITHDTTLVTKNGALLKIPQGSLVTDKGNTVTLEIKEAYSLQQIIEAGLTTQSNGEPLSSGGMIYINAKGGQNVTITKAIKVALPADYLNKDMQLFKGEKDEKGNINWNKPTALPENKQLSSIEQGKLLFQSKCASCHAIGKDLVGPNLAHFNKRFTGEERKLIGYHLHYPFHADSIEKVDTTSKDSPRYNTEEEYGLYLCNLRHMYSSIGIFSDFSANDLDNIYRYIQNESDSKNLPLPSHAYLKDCVDSCYNYRRAVGDLLHQKEKAQSKKQKLVIDNGGLVKEDRTPAAPSANNVSFGPSSPVNFDERVSPKYYEAEYYQFSIESFGWFNIDCMMKGIDGVEESELFVRIMGQYREKIKLYLIIPSKKIFVEGGPAERNPEEFAFYLKNGKIPLAQNTTAYILALTETEESIAFAIKDFTTSIKQEFDISLNQSTKEAFTSAINGLNLDKINIKVADSKNANEIRKTNTDLKVIDEELKKAENLKPKNCNCECGLSYALQIPIVEYPLNK